MKKKILTGLAMGVFMFGGLGVAEATFLGPSPYLSLSDSPFNSTTFSYFYLENFEDLALNTPGVSVDHGLPINSTITYASDSVDGDDGSIDGDGGNGASIWDPTSMTFTFDASTLGALPTHAGIVWTDGTPGGVVTFTAFDANGISFGAVSAYLGDNTFLGTTAEDRFFGVTDAGGISRITVTDNGSANNLELDHLQYGRAAAEPVPEPTTMLLLGTGLTVLAGVRRNKKL